MHADEPSAAEPQPQALECADLSALSAGDLSPSSASGAARIFPRAAGRGPALATSRQSGESGDESPHSKSLSSMRELSSLYYRSEALPSHLPKVHKNGERQGNRRRLFRF